MLPAQNDLCQKPQAPGQSKLLRYNLQLEVVSTVVSHDDMCLTADSVHYFAVM